MQKKRNNTVNLNCPYFRYSALPPKILFCTEIHHKRFILPNVWCSSPQRKFDKKEGLRKFVVLQKKNCCLSKRFLQTSWSWVRDQNAKTWKKGFFFNFQANQIYIFCSTLLWTSSLTAFAKSTRWVQSKSCSQSNQLRGKISAEPGFKPGVAGWGARMLPQGCFWFQRKQTSLFLSGF